MTDKMLELWVSLENGVEAAKDRAREEVGATTVEYVMILGIMALIVAAIFLSNGGIRDKLWNDGGTGLGNKVIKTITDIG